MKIKLLVPAMMFCVSALAQSYSIESFNNELLNWYSKDPGHEEILGLSLKKAYDSLLNGKICKDTIVVAVIDGGVDINHEELTGLIWINKNEIPGNNIDDDNNGYIDDIHGWNYLGNNDGYTIRDENLEYTRIVKNGDSTTNPDYSAALQLYLKELEERQSIQEKIDHFEESLTLATSIISENTGIEVKTMSDLQKVVTTDQSVRRARKYLMKRFKKGFSYKALEAIKERNNDYLYYFLNKDFNPRDSVGDNPEDMHDTFYGNNDVVGPRPEHGTSVAGVIAANRSNDLGIDGITNNVKIMPLRIVPNGDERDKDIALAIIYAVDHGARVINMSFGKKFSPHKSMVDSAARYAASRGVLLVHAAGNDGYNIDVVDSYPKDVYEDNSEIPNWITIGASGLKIDKHSPGEFSNYGQNHVDIFAPGVDILSLDNANTYSVHDGTSLAAPMVSGVAALILSYYPDLTSKELIDILVESSYKITKPKKVLQPDLENKKRAKVPFSTLCKSGGVVNVYQALQMAEEKYDE